MAVTLRLSRIGKKHVPFFRIVAVDSRKKRDGECLAVLGTYDGLKTKIVTFDEKGINDWIAKGAQVSDAVKKIIRLNKEASKPATAKKEVAKKAAPKKEAAPKEAAPKKEEVKAEAKEAQAPEAPKVEKKAAPAKEEKAAEKPAEAESKKK